MGWLIGLASVLLFGLIPIGLRGIYDASGGRVWLKIASFQFLLYPKRPGKSVTRKKKKASNGAKKSSKEKTHKSGGNTTEFTPIVRFVLEILKNLWKKLQVDLLELKVVLAQEDPSDLAINYGRTWAALGNLIPQLERYCNIKKRDIAVTCDFVDQQVQIFAQIQISITLGRAIFLLARQGLHVIKNDLQSSNNKKAVQEHESKSS